MSRPSSPAPSTWSAPAVARPLPAAVLAARAGLGSTGPARLVCHALPLLQLPLPRLAPPHELLGTARALPHASYPVMFLAANPPPAPPLLPGGPRAIHYRARWPAHPLHRPDKKKRCATLPLALKGNAHENHSLPHPFAARNAMAGPGNACHDLQNQRMSGVHFQRTVAGRREFAAALHLLYAPLPKPTEATHA